MEVTKDNFENILPQVLEDIESCTFASIDLELTGLWAKGEPGSLDPQHEYYSMFLTSASNFICIQYGLSLFKMNPVDKSYECKTYNFYVFPRQFQKNSSYTFSCQASSIDFLASCNFDFNKALKKGIPYLNIEKEAQLTELLEEKRFYKEKSLTKDQEKILIPEEHMELVQETCEKLGSVLDGGEEEVSVSGLNAYIRRLIYQEMKEKFPNGEVLVDTREGVMFGRKGAVDGHKPKSQLEIDEDVIAKAVGFSKVIKALSKSNKYIVGHNAFLDICHTVNNFLCDLPASYKEFKGLIRGVFPKIVDTKFISSFEGMKDFISSTTVNRLYSRIRDPPFSLPDIKQVEGYCYEDDCEAYHDAGFDSYVTGVCFIAMFNYIAGSKDTEGNVHFKSKISKLDNYVNRIFMNNSPDNHMHLGGNDPVPDRSHYFHISFPKSWVAYDIVNLFSAYGRVNINWINETSAWVNLTNASQAQAARNNLCGKGCPAGVKVSPYTPSSYSAISLSRKRTFENNVVASSPRPKRHRSSTEHSFSNKSVIETIPEEKEVEEGDDISDPENNKSRNDSQDSDDAEPEKKKSKKDSDDSDEWQTHSSRRKKKRRHSGEKKLKSKKKERRHSGEKRKRQSSPSPKAGKVIAELEKDLDYDPSNNPFSGSATWDIS